MLNCPEQTPILQGQISEGFAIAATLLFSGGKQYVWISFKLFCKGTRTKHLGEFIL